MRPKGKNVIFTDFNGVLNDPAKTLGHQDLVFEVPKIADPEKVFRLAKLSLETDSEVVLTSSYRHQVSFYLIAGRCLRNSDNPDHNAFFKEHGRSMRDKWTHTTGKGQSRSQEIKGFLQDFENTGHEYENIVVFEDEEPIDKSLNPIITDRDQGLTQECCEQARSMLSPSRKNKTIELSL